MTRRRSPTVSDVLTAVREELADRASMARRETPETEDPARLALDLARSLQGSFRAEPVGGRLLPLKRVVHWFVASAFDRQAKVVEAMLPALEAMRAELIALRREVAELRRSQGGGVPPGDR